MLSHCKTGTWQYIHDLVLRLPHFDYTEICLCQSSRGTAGCLGQSVCFYHVVKIFQLLARLTQICPLNLKI